jgi:hypothetical protein
MTTALEGGEGSVSHPGRSLPPGKTRYLLYRRLGGPQGRCKQVRKITPPPGFDPQAVQPVASRYTDCITRPTFFYGQSSLKCNATLVISPASGRIVSLVPNPLQELTSECLKLYICFVKLKKKLKQSLYRSITGSEGSRRLRLPRL